MAVNLALRRHGLIVVGFALHPRPPRMLLQAPADGHNDEE